MKPMTSNNNDRVETLESMIYLCNVHLSVTSFICAAAALHNITRQSTMSNTQDLDEWAARAHLTPDTVTVLREEGFTSLELLQLLTPDDVTEMLQNTKRVPMAQSLALKAAIKQLAGKSSAPEAVELCQHDETSLQEDLEDNLPQQMEETSLLEEGITYRFLMVGKTGAGKSTTGNTILGENLFDSEASFDSVTDECALKRNTYNDVSLEILDSPGLFDTRKGHEAVATAIAKSVAGMNPGPHAILYVIKIGRYTEEEEGVYNRLLELFDKDLASYTIVVFTGGDSIKGGLTVEELLENAPENMKRILKACKNRYVVFNNMASDKQPQVDELMSKVKELVAENKGKPYSCPKYFHIGEAMEEEVAKRMAKVEEKHMKTKRYVQELEAKTKEAEDSLTRETEEFHKREEARQQAMKREEEMRRAQIETLKQQLEQQQISEEMQRQKTEALMQKLEEERKQQMREREEERKQEQEILRRKEEAMKKWMAQKIEEQKKYQEEMKRAHEKEIRELKDGIVDGSEQSLMSFVSPLATAYAMLFRTVYNLLNRRLDE